MSSCQLTPSRSRTHTAQSLAEQSQLDGTIIGAFEGPFLFLYNVFLRPPDGLVTLLTMYVFWCLHSLQLQNIQVDEKVRPNAWFRWFYPVW